MDLSKLIAMAAPMDVHPERCIHQFSPRATCDKCLRFCPAESISLKGGEISVATCDGCGRCVQACPRKLIQLSTHINKKGYNAAYCTDVEQCVACGMCYQMCPDCVIRVERQA